LKKFLGSKRKNETRKKKEEGEFEKKAIEEEEKRREEEAKKKEEELAEARKLQDNLGKYATSIHHKNSLCWILYLPWHPIK